MKSVFPGKPKARICPNCGSEFGSASFLIHIKTCPALPKPPTRSNPTQFVQRQPKIRAALRTAVPEQALVTLLRCKHCGRSFTQDRLRKHESVCLAAKPKKVKVFNSAKQRIGPGALKAQKRTQRVDNLRNGKWKREHLEFVTAIRYARKLTRAEAAGVDIRSIPPPAVSSHTNDYIQCPFCERRFAQNVAERHIPKCRDIVNKPKPPPVHSAVVSMQSRPLRRPQEFIHGPIFSQNSLNALPRTTKKRSMSQKNAGTRLTPMATKSIATCRGCGKLQTPSHACAYLTGLMRLIGTQH